MSTDHRLPPLSELIERLRVDKDLTQEELAERVGVTRNAVTNWEAGKHPNRPNTRRLEQALGLPRFYLEAEADWDTDPPGNDAGQPTGGPMGHYGNPMRRRRRGDRRIPQRPADSPLAHAA